MGGLDELAAAVRAAFGRVHRDVFLGDSVANARLTVDVVDAAVVAGVSCVVLVTPWTVNGLIFSEGDFPDWLDLARRRHRVFRVTMAGLAPFGSVNLPVATAALHDMAQARALARSWIAPLHEAIRAARTAPAADVSG